MNTLINELIRECTSIDGLTFDKERYTIAIIAECIVAISDISYSIDESSVERVRENTKKIREHFGLEE